MVYYKQTLFSLALINMSIWVVWPILGPKTRLYLTFKSLLQTRGTEKHKLSLWKHNNYWMQGRDNAFLPSAEVRTRVSPGSESCTATPDACVRIYTTRFPHCQSQVSPQWFSNQPVVIFQWWKFKSKDRSPRMKTLNVLSRARKVLWRRDRKWTDRWLQHSALDTNADMRAFDQRKGNIYRNNCTFGDIV